MIPLAGKRVLVTGASRGIGLGIARAFAAAGADLAILADNAEVTDAAALLGREHGRPVRVWRCDITRPEELAAVAAEIETLDILVNNAGLERITPIEDPDPEIDRLFERMIAINITGTWAVTRALVGRLRRGGRIINTASVWGKSAVAEFSGYVATKHAIIGLTRSLARELGPRGITVNAVCPGWVRTEASLRSLSTMAERSGRSETSMLGDILAAQALPGLMEPQDVAGLYLYLASDLAANITGQALGIDRGEFPG
ncbi:MAG TPA: SDR family NAD(P)-dependent oxidoreductase [Aliidongia sp.]|nr:SDR family NAD(P)-dependent oxidoreductase [Aliidongia sp.]